MAAQVREAAVFDRSRQATVYTDGTKAQINGDFRTNETTAIANWPHLGVCNYTQIFFPICNWKWTELPKIHSYQTI